MAYQMTKLVNAFTNDDGQRRFTWNPALAGHDEESGKGARYVYGKIRFVGTVEEFQSQLGGQPLPEDLIPTVKENLGEQGHTDEEIEAIISALS